MMAQKYGDFSSATELEFIRPHRFHHIAPCHVAMLPKEVHPVHQMRVVVHDALAPCNAFRRPALGAPVVPEV